MTRISPSFEASVTFLLCMLHVLLWEPMTAQTLTKVTAYLVCKCVVTIDALIMRRSKNKYLCETHKNRNSDSINYDATLEIGYIIRKCL